RPRTPRRPPRTAAPEGPTVLQHTTRRIPNGSRGYVTTRRRRASCPVKGRYRWLGHTDRGPPDVIPGGGMSARWRQERERYQVRRSARRLDDGVGTRLVKDAAECLDGCLAGRGLRRHAHCRAKGSVAMDRHCPKVHGPGAPDEQEHEPVGLSGGIAGMTRERPARHGHLAARPYLLRAELQR